MVHPDPTHCRFDMYCEDSNNQIHTTRRTLTRLVEDKEAIAYFYNKGLDFYPYVRVYE